MVGVELATSQQVEIVSSIAERVAMLIGGPPSTRRQNVSAASVQVVTRKSTAQAFAAEFNLRSAGT